MRMTELESAVCAMNVPVGVSLGSVSASKCFNEAWSRPFQLACLRFSQQTLARCLRANKWRTCTAAEAHTDAASVSQSVTLLRASVFLRIDGNVKPGLQSPTNCRDRFGSGSMLTEA